MKQDVAAKETFGEANYTRLPKSVLALLAYSFAQRLCEDTRDRDVILRLIALEWRTLHDNGIAPQLPVPLETREEEARRMDMIAEQVSHPSLVAYAKRRAQVLRAAP